MSTRANARPSRLFLILLAGLTLALGAAATAGASGFATGDLLVVEGAFSGPLGWYRDDGTLVRTLGPPATVAAAADDPLGRVWATNLSNAVYAFGANGSSLGPIVDPFFAAGADPEGISFDVAGNAYVGVFSDEAAGIRKFSPAGAYVGTVVEDPSDFVDVAADQCTVYWQDVNDEQISRIDQCVPGSAAELVFVDGPGEPAGMRLLGDGSILSNEREEIVRFLPLGGGSALVVGRYLPPNPCARWGYHLALGVGARTFWASCDNVPREVDVQTGAVLRSLPGAPGRVVAVYRGFRAALGNTPTQLLVGLQVQIDGYGLKHGLGPDLNRYLNLAVKHLQRGETEKACQRLGLFLSTVERTAAKTPPWLAPDQAASLAQEGRAMRSAPGC